MHAIAWIYIGASAVLALTPGRVYKGKPEPDWSSPKVYIAFVATIAAAALAIGVVR